MRYGAMLLQGEQGVNIMDRGNPEKILRQLKAAEQMDNQPVQGRLKIFFGYAAGVGKTYAMLEAAHEAQKAGVDVVCGYIEPHQRPATAALLEGLEVLSLKKGVYHGIELAELDVDGVLARRPQLVLVDELAHTNAPFCRHQKRMQDIEELLHAGINVYTSVNVQH
ncbi:histidine kinase, partial [Anaerovibrio sp.]|uniref:histidine kinase n=1 Tax=Anaerovibrio sp. TaxID=1872532 RepID=UPI003F15EE87